MNKTLNTKYEYGVGTTTKKVTRTLLGFWKKDREDQECQTLTFDDIVQNFQDQIESLEKSLKMKNDERKIIEADIARLKKQMEYMSL